MYYLNAGPAEPVGSVGPGPDQFAPSMLTILAFRPETRTYLPFEINLQNMKYIP